MFDEHRAFSFRHAESDEHNVLTFDRFAAALVSVDVGRLKVPDQSDNYDFGEYAARCVLSDPSFPSLGLNGHDLRWSAGEFLDNMDPYVTLRLLAENPRNLDRSVIWRYHDAVDSGFVEDEGIFSGLSPDDQFLVVTEGTSDTNILKKTLIHRYPEVADFFLFVDMKENYPFSGTGNLLRFVQGLVAIRHLRRTLVVVDNDTVGNEVAGRLSELPLLQNIAVCVLPTLDSCVHFDTAGPSGRSIEDVNGSAGSIEMFLDLNFEPTLTPIVRWTSYNAKLDRYQGELERKEEFVRKFLKSGWRSTVYDWSKLSMLWERLFEASARLAEK
jgi:hypothetical protein